MPKRECRAPHQNRNRADSPSNHKKKPSIGSRPSAGTRQNPGRRTSPNSHQLRHRSLLPLEMPALFFQASHVSYGFPLASVQSPGISRTIAFRSRFRWPRAITHELLPIPSTRSSRPGAEYQRIGEYSSDAQFG